MPRLTKTLLYLVYVLIVGGLITAISAAFHGKVSAPSTNVSQGHQVVRQAPKSSSGSNNSNKANSGKTSPSTPSSTSPGSNSQLSNTGPGDTLTVFTLVSVGGAWIYRRQLIRKQD